MNKRIVLMSVLLTTVGSFMCMLAGADNITINTPGAGPFRYEDHSYLPLQSVADFLGAPLRWDSANRQSIITYNGQDLALTPNSSNALFKGKRVKLSTHPVVFDGRTYVPVDAFSKFYKVPVEWDKSNSEVRIKGPNGWGRAKINNRTSWHGGPPPWAPAFGRRYNKQWANKSYATGNQKQLKDYVKQKAKAQKNNDRRSSNLIRKEPKDHLRYQLDGKDNNHSKNQGKRQGR